MSKIDIADAILDQVRVGIGAAADGFIEKVIKSLFSHPAYSVIAGGQLLLIERGIDPWKAWKTSRRCLREFMKDHGVAVGDPAYAWDQQGGREIVQAYEIDHWEQGQ